MCLSSGLESGAIAAAWAAGQRGPRSLYKGRALGPGCSTTSPASRMRSLVVLLAVLALSQGSGITRWASVPRGGEGISWVRPGWVSPWSPGLRSPGEASEKVRQVPRTVEVKGMASQSDLLRYVPQLRPKFSQLPVPSLLTCCPSRTAGVPVSWDRVRSTGASKRLEQRLALCKSCALIRQTK